MAKLSQKFVASLDAVTVDIWHWDDTIKGFAVRQRPGADPQWWVRYAIERKKRKLLIGPCAVVKAEAARERAREILEMARIGKDHNEAKRARKALPTIEDLAREHQLVHVPPAISQDTWKDRATHWKKHIVPTIGKIRVSELSRADLIKFHQKFKAQPHLANRLLATLSKALNDCTTWTPKWREDNPAYRIPKFEEPHRQVILSMEEVTKVLYRLRSLRHNRGPGWAMGWLYHALLISGLRLSELSRRKWTDIDLYQGTLFIPKAKNKKPRKVSLSNEMVDLLRSVPRECEWVFPSSRGKPFTCPQHLWQKIRADLDLPQVRLHDLRHTVASYAMSEGGLSQREVMELLGHSQMSTTERYLNVHDERKKSISDRASKAISSFG